MSGVKAGEPSEQFISEAIVPVPGSFDAAAMARGEAGVPRRFSWRGRAFVVEQLLSSWKSSSRDRGELYLRRHWFAVRTVSGERMTLYCERQASSPKRAKSRWWLYSMAEPAPRSQPPSAPAPTPPAPPLDPGTQGGGGDGAGKETPPS
jgi:hypothetical protein